MSFTANQESRVTAMFHFLGKMVARGWPLWLLGWGVLLVASARMAPPWQTVVRHGDAEFLPADVPSRRGEDLFDRAFPGQRSHSNVVLVVHREVDAFDAQDRQFIAETLTPRLKRVVQGADP